MEQGLYEHRGLGLGLIAWGPWMRNNNPGYGVRCLDWSHGEGPYSGLEARGLEEAFVAAEEKRLRELARLLAALEDL